MQVRALLINYWDRQFRLKLKLSFGLWLGLGCLIFTVARWPVAVTCVLYLPCPQARGEQALYPLTLRHSFRPVCMVIECKYRKKLRAVNNFVESGTHFLPLPVRRLPTSMGEFPLLKPYIIYLSQTANWMPPSLSACRKTTLVKRGSKNWPSSADFAKAFALWIFWIARLWSVSSFLSLGSSAPSKITKHSTRLELKAVKNESTAW